MKQFMDKDFLLTSEAAKKLYHDHAEKMPIIDYHCHLSPKDIWENKKFKNLSEVWLGPGDRTGDHYKWRALRAMGFQEDTISGAADDKLKYDQFVTAMPYFVGNPLYHWSHLELRRYFDIDLVINEKNKDQIWELANKKLETLTAREMLKKMNVKLLCTTDDPTDDLKYHKLIKEDKTFDIQVLPTFRPDKALNIEQPGWLEYIEKLGSVTDLKIKTVKELETALSKRIDYFHEVGGRVADHGLEEVYYAEATEQEVNEIIAKAFNKVELTKLEVSKFKGWVQVFLGREYNKRNWTQQYHIGAIRNNNTNKYKEIGPDTGFDGIGDKVYIETLRNLLDKQESTKELPKTILYCLNNRDNYALTVLAGHYQREGHKSWCQAGTAWWFLDQQDGMKENLEVLMQVAIISNAVGMLTDSRSLLAYPRHEYYRRILCEKLGHLVENGEYPAEELDRLGEIVEDICYKNASKFFGFNL